MGVGRLNLLCAGAAQGLVEALQADQQRIVKHDIEELEASNRAKEELVLTFQVLEQNRLELTARLGHELGIPADEVRVSRALYTDGIPDPDLLIRTSGEQRLSNFLLWQIAYTELWMTPTLWPDFGAREFCLAVAEFQQRDRRFGRV